MIRSLFSRIKEQDIKSAELVQLRKYQLDLKRLMADTGKHLMVCWSRRAGKDVFTFSMAAEQCKLPNQRVYYFLPTQKQAKLVLIDGVLDDGRSFLESIIDVNTLQRTTRGNLIHSDNTIRFKNGSVIYLFGADTGDTKVGKRKSAHYKPF